MYGEQALRCQYATQYQDGRMERDELEMAAAAGRALDECKRFIARVLDESGGRSTTEYSKPIEAWAHGLGLVLLDVGRQALEWAGDRGFVVVEAGLPTGEEGR